jgi:transposase-like protein
MPESKILHHTYPPEFEREAAQIYQVSRESISKMTEELEVATESLRRWS